ncbi:MAG: PorP/SprF family type IX secretion system membrane protein [Flavobacteriales bacterium]
MPRHLFISFSLFFFALAGYGQDYHVSRYEDVPLYHNPALTGSFPGVHQARDADYRIAVNGRSQWQALGVDPYRSAYVAYDQPFKERFGIGGYLIDNHAGSNAFNVIQGKLSGSYHITERGSPHFLKTGLGLGIFHTSFDPGAFSYENEYAPSAGGFDNSLSTGENFQRRSRLGFDAELGVYYAYREKKTYQPFIGISTFHIPRPKESLLGKGGRVPLRWVGMLGSGIKVDEKLRLRPGILYMKQRAGQELHFRSDLRYKLGGAYSILFGAGYRLKDALVLGLGIQQKRNTLRFSYDINTSSLQHYTGGAGAWEIALVLRGKKGEPLFHPKFL